MTASFTPGPWTDVSLDESKWGVYDSRGLTVAQAQQIKPRSVDLKQVERTANARLIAAAPDLYSVVKELEESACYWSEYDVPIGIVDRIRAALAKAEGTTP